MKSLIRNFLINLGALWLVSQIFPGLEILGNIYGLTVGAAAFMAVNILLVPLIKILLLPLNLLTLGLFTWLSNVLALYFLVSVLPYLKLVPYHFSGASFDGFVVPAIDFSTFYVAIIVSLLIGLITHFVFWLIK
jgi:putative membrane protein